MSKPKDKHYWTQLRAALTAGQWAVRLPAKTPNGTPLTWSELFRKFNKHCRGYQDVSEVASQTHVLALLFASTSKGEDRGDSGKVIDFPLDLGDECLLPEERIGEANMGYDVLRKLESSNFDVGLLPTTRSNSSSHVALSRHYTLLWRTMPMLSATPLNASHISTMSQMSPMSRVIYPPSDQLAPV
jgi:hypothetical protein